MSSDRGDLDEANCPGRDLETHFPQSQGEADPAGCEDLARRAAVLLSDPGFAPMVKAMARDLIAVYDASPRLGKLLGSYRRWYMVQVGFSFHARRHEPGHEAGLTASRLASYLERLGLASRNTVSGFIAEMVAYRLLTPVAGRQDRRSRPLMPTESATGAMAKWLDTNLAALDRLDRGSRRAMFADRIELLEPVQVKMVDLLSGSRSWLLPGPRIMNFLGRDAGGLVLDGLISELDLAHLGKGRLPIGKINISRMARRFQLSRINLDRMLKQAEENGSIGRQEDGGYFMDEAFFREQLGRQALKFACIDLAWCLASNRSEETEWQE